MERPTSWRSDVSSCGARPSRGPCSGSTRTSKSKGQTLLVVLGALVCAGIVVAALLVSRALSSAARTVSDGMTQLAESFGGFFATDQAQFVNLEDVVAALHMEEGSAGTEMVFDTDTTDV